jgi:hypothetical protein
MDFEDKSLVDMLKFGFPASYEGPVPHPTDHNHASAIHHPEAIKAYTDKETHEGAMLGPFSDPPFHPWTQTNPLMTRPKRASHERRVIMDLSWPPPPGVSVNGFTPKDTYLGIPYKMHLPGAEDFMELIRKAGRGALMFSVDISRAYRHLPADPLSYSLICCKTQEGYFSDISLPFGLRWAAAACQRVTNLYRHAMAKQGVAVINYIDDCASVASHPQQASTSFAAMKATLVELGLPEAEHKAAPPSSILQWLGLRFDSNSMQVSIPQDKLDEVADMLKKWAGKRAATLHELRVLLGKLLFVAQCSKPARMFLGRMLATLRDCPPQGPHTLPSGFFKDLTWFRRYLPATNGIFFIHELHQPEVEMWVDSSPQAGGAMCQQECYHAVYPPAVATAHPDICHLELLNAMAALRQWAPTLRHKDVTLYSDSMVAVSVLQAGRSRDELLLTCAREIWLICTSFDINLTVTHVPGQSLEATADALSRLHMGEPFISRVENLLASRKLAMITVPDSIFSLDSAL